MRDLFSSPRVLVGVVHLPALPGTPGNTLAPGRIVEQAVAEARILKDSGFHSIILENMHDRPYLKGAVGPEITACMTAVCREVRRVVDLPLGIQVLAGANEAALAVAHAGGADYIRAEGFVFAHLADEGLIEACAGPLLRYRKQIGADHIKILCDIKKKHSSHALTADLDLAETARAADFFLADGLVVTGTATGAETSPGDLKRAADVTDLPVWIGSGVNPDNIASYVDAHGLIVGSWLKEGGDWRRPVDPERCRRLADLFEVDAWTM